LFFHGGISFDTQISSPKNFTILACSALYFLTEGACLFGEKFILFQEGLAAN
jgi:hypothetical protein